MGRFSFNIRRDLGTYLFGLWLVLLGLVYAPFVAWGGQHWVNVVLGVLLIVSGVFHLIEL